MSDSDDKEAYYATLGLSPDATFDQVKSRFRELNDAYLKILESSRSSARAGNPGRHASNDDDRVQRRPQQGASPKQPSPQGQKTRTEPIATIKARFEKGELQKAQFEKLAKERYDYLENKPFSELSDSEFEERIHGFDGLKFLRI